MKEANFYFEVVTCYDGDEVIECGFIPADSFVEAMTIIEDYFRKELCCVNKLEWLNTSLITMNKDIAQKVYDYNV